MRIRKREKVALGGADIGGRENLDHAEHQPCDHGARHVAESAQQHHDQSLDRGAKPHERRDALFLMPSSTPATPAMPEPMMKVISTTRLTSTPSNAAVSWFSAVARMARPSLAALDEQPEQHHQRERHAEDEDLRRADGDRPEAIELLRDGLGKGELLAADE